MTGTLPILAGLIAGLLLGGFLGRDSWVIPFLEPLGTLFVNAIRMVVVPLVAAKLIVAVGSTGDAGSLRKLGTAAAIVTLVLLFAAATFAGSLAWLVFHDRPVDPAITKALWESSPSFSPASIDKPTLGKWLVSLVPENVFASASQNAMLPLIFFSLLFGLSLTRIKNPQRDTILGFFAGIGDAMLVIIRWILLTAPVGVFALGVPLAARMGLSAAAVLLQYVALVAVGCVVFAVVVLYPLAVLGGRARLGPFFRATAPAQAVAFSTRSSMAALPIMVEEGRDRLNLAGSVTGFFMPLAVSTFRVGSVIGTTIAVLFLANLYAVPLNVSLIATVILIAVPTTIGSLGTPSGAILVVVPVLTAAGLPPEGVALLLGIDVLPDMFRTSTNATAVMASSCWLDRWTSRPGSRPISMDPAS